jgi:hypothetical protein
LILRVLQRAQISVVSPLLRPMSEARTKININANVQGIAQVDTDQQLQRA